MEAIGSSDDLEGCTILLVEDDAIAAIDMRNVLEMAGAKVLGPAYSLGQGFHLLDDAPIDCALLDINLNSLVVFGLADALAERKVPIVFLSADTLDRAPSQHRTGRLVHKPFSTHTLIRAVRATIAEKRNHTEGHPELSLSPSI
jgi:Response regulator containing CheY-like receiver, AAA-type ATPase, and DNA-binding domains